MQPRSGHSSTPCSHEQYHLPSRRRLCLEHRGSRIHAALTAYVGQPHPERAALDPPHSVRQRLDFTRPFEPEVVRECLALALQTANFGNALRQRWTQHGPPATWSTKPSQPVPARRDGTTSRGDAMARGKATALGHFQGLHITSFVRLSIVILACRLLTDELTRHRPSPGAMGPGKR